MATPYGRIVRDGLWDNNGVIAMLLGLSLIHISQGIVR